MKLSPWLPALPVLAVLGGCVSPNYPPPVTTQAPVQPPAPVEVQPPAANEETLRALAQLTELKEELKKLRNAVEEIEFNTDTAKRRQQNLFQDLDRRLLAVERAQRLQALAPVAPAANTEAGLDANDDAAAGADPAAISATTPGVAGDGAAAEDTGADTGADAAVVTGDTAAAGTTTTTVAPPEPEASAAAPAGTVSVPEQQAYDNAFNLLKQSKYQDSIEQFQQLAATWPDGQLADDAHYWMSEARYVNREFEAALAGFRTVVTRYPDSQRVPEALLKMGYIQYDIGAYREAAEIFRDILARFPGHQVAVSAQTRLRRIEQTIQ